MYRFIDILKDPNIVWNIQNFFGVSYEESIASRKVVDHEHYSEESSSMLRKKTARNPVEVEDNKDTEEFSHKLNNGSLGIEEAEFKAEAGNKTLPEIKDSKNYVIRNKIWYFVFLFGTYLGDDVGYAIVLPFWFWNVDAKIGRKIVLVWTLTMYIGQTCKDIIRWPRPPCPPVIRLQKKWALEYGMPSTHAMVGVALPSSVLYYTSRRYKFSVEYGVTLAILWCVLISFSRLYLGMHSLLDILVGLLLSSLLVIPLLPIMDYVGDVSVEYYWVPLLIMVITVVLIVIYPTGNTWTPTRGDTTTILATCMGFQTAGWLNYQLFGRTQSPPFPPPYNFYFPEWSEIGFIVLRTLLGYLGIVISFIIFELIKKFLDCILTGMKVTVRDVRSNRRVPIVDLIYKYLTYSITSFHVACSLPYLFHFLNIGRSNYYWE